MTLRYRINIFVYRLILDATTDGLSVYTVIDVAKLTADI